MTYKSKVYKVALRKRKDSQDFFYKLKDYKFAVLDFNVSNRYWMADPFLYERDGITYLFYEMYDYFRGRGVLAYSIINDDFSVSKPKIIINEKFHLSFPNIFDYNEEIYLIPESCGDGSILLYKATSFPDKWEKIGSLVQSINACDSILLHENDKVLLHTCVMSKKITEHIVSCFVKNLLFTVEIPNSAGKEFGELVATECGMGDYGLRNAGACFFDDGKIYRVGQDCRNAKYGQGLCFFSIESVKPYKEELEKTVSLSDIAFHITNCKKNIFCGFHTYNMTSKYEVIDIALQEKLPTYYKFVHFIYRIINFIGKIIKRLLH